MATPPVPPRPLDSYDRYPHDQPPPIPPLPQGIRLDLESDLGSRPHYEDPLVAPRPQKLQPDLPSNMARTLHEQTASPYPQAPADYVQARQPQAPYPPPGYPPAGRNPNPYPLPAQAQAQEWSPWGGAAITSPPPPPPQGYPGGTLPFPAGQYSLPPVRQDDFSASFSALSLGPQQQQPSQPHHQHQHSRTSSAYGSPPQLSPPISQSAGPSQPAARPPMSTMPLNIAKSPSPPRQPEGTMGPPSLTAPLPTINGLTSALHSVQQPGGDPASKVTWCKDVLSLVSRAESTQAAAANPTNVGAADIPVGPVRISDPALQRLIDVAVPLILKLSTPAPMPNPMPAWLAEATYLRATCESSGAYPQYISASARSAFRDFEQAARNGYHAAWFKLGRDYENFNDNTHAKNCFERGVNHGDERCLYRMGMAHLMGQLNLPPSPDAAIPLLQRAATLATVDVPQPAYVFGLLLLQEFSHISIAPNYFLPYIPPGSSAQAEARKHLERAAYLNYPPAQYKLGHAYEFATPPFPFDALLSVQYYSLASQQGEVEADMALSKWFLCGADGAFDKDESLAYTFAEKAAKKGLASAEFAMGYYAEVGVGGPKDIESARRWYTKAVEHGNQDASDRLSALSQPLPQALSRAEHENLTETKLVRTRTQAKQRSDAAGSRPAPMPAVQGAHIVENARRNSVMRPPMVSAPSGPPPRPNYGAPMTEEPHPHGRTASVSSYQQPPTQTSPYGSPRNRPGDLPPSQTTSPRPFANAPRYSLADPGSGTASGPRPPPQQSSFGPPRQNRPQAQSPPVGPSTSQSPSASVPLSAPSDPPRKGPQTFAEMGIVTTKAEDKECIVM